MLCLRLVLLPSRGQKNNNKKQKKKLNAALAKQFYLPTLNQT